MDAPAVVDTLRWQLAWRNMRRVLLVLAIAMTAACGAKATGTGVVAPTPHDVSPIVVRVSTFYSDLERACPDIRAATAAPDGVAATVWTELKGFCATANRDPSTLHLAVTPDRQAILAAVTAGLSNRPVASPTKDLTALCARTAPDKIKATAKNKSARDLLVGICKDASDVTDAELAALSDAVGLLQEDAPNDKAVATLLAFAASASAVSSRSSGSGLASLLPSGGFDVSSMVDVALKGLAQFLVKRAELELRTYAIDKMRKVAQCNEPVASSVVHGLLVSTCGFLGGDTGTLPAGFGPGLRAAFADDLAALPRNLVRQTPAEGGAGELVMRVALEAAAIVVEDPDPMQIVARIEVLTDSVGEGAFACKRTGDEQQACLETMATLYTGAALARIILEDGDPIRVTPQMLLEMLGLRLTEIRTHLDDSTKLAKAIDAVTDVTRSVDPAKWRAFFIELLDDVTKVIDGLKAARATLAALPSTATDVERAKAVVDATRFGMRSLDRAVAIAACLGSATSIDTPPSCKTDRTYLPGQLADFLDALRQNDLGGVMAMGLTMARGALGDRFSAYVSADVARLLSFGAELANAKTSNEAEAAIEAIAMPPGGYKEKRKRDFLSITALVGAGAGVEWISGAASSRGWTTGLLGAVGIDYNHHFEMCDWTLGVYLTVIDLGGILNVRGGDESTDDGDVAAEPTVGFAQVFAPGLGIRAGLGDSPVVLMIGGQIIPNGRTITDDKMTTDTTDDITTDRSSVRVMASLGVDVTIWAF